MARRLHLKRYRQIISVFARNGFAVLLDQLGLFSYLRLRRRKILPDQEGSTEAGRLSVGERLRKSCEELGPTFIKIGQIISTRPDIISPEVAQELARLQDSVNPFPFEDVCSVVEQEFGEPLNQVFERFERKPIAAASLSQVHQAVLPTGKSVAVKVQRPGIESSIKVDLEILQDLMRFVENHTRFGDLYDFAGMLEELEKTIKDELDFRKEGENADRFSQIFAEKDQLAVPVVHWIYTTSRVLTLSYIEGIRVNKPDTLKKAGIDCTDLGLRLARGIVEQIFAEGFFHADPHPGNLLIQTDGTIVFLDLGMVGRLNDGKRRILADMFVGIAAQDAHQVVQAFMDMDTMRQRVNVHRFEAAIDKLLDQYMSLPMNEIKIGALLAKIFQLAFVYHVRIPAAFTLIAKVLITLQSVLEQLDPEINMLVIMKPIAGKLMQQQFSIDDTLHALRRTGSDYQRLLGLLPTFLVNLFHKLEDDEYRIELELKDIDKVQKHLDQTFNRISFSLILLGVSIIIAGIIIGTSMSAGIGPEMSRLNLLMMRGGLVVAGAILVGLVISMFRSRRF